MNHNAKPISIYLKDGVPFLDIAPGTYHIGAENIGAYLGFIIGEVTEAGDWFLPIVTTSMYRPRLFQIAIVVE